MIELTQQQQGLLEQYTRTHAAMTMAVNFEDFQELGTAYAAAIDTCLAAGFDPFHYPTNPISQEDYD